MADVTSNLVSIDCQLSVQSPIVFFTLLKSVTNPVASVLISISLAMSAIGRSDGTYALIRARYFLPTTGELIRPLTKLKIMYGGDVQSRLSHRALYNPDTF